MKKIALVTGLLLSSASFASGVHWTYSGHEGPEYWGSLSPDYAACSGGKNQSPVDIAAMAEAELSPIEFAYQSGGDSVVNNGHTIKVGYAAGSSISVDGHSYELKQFHFHAPSENLIEGQSFPMEMHLVHADSSGNLAVVGVMFKEGETNAELEKAWAVMPDHEGEAKPSAALAAEALLPGNHDYYRFSGSLTTPPCSEGVLWLVMKDPVTASKAQIEAFEHVMHHPNNRPVQPLNARKVMQ